MKSTVQIFGLCCLSALLVCPTNAHAYIDPGTGSYIFQLIIAGILSALVSIKIFWRQIKAFFSRLFGGSKSPDEQESK